MYIPSEFSGIRIAVSAAPLWFQSTPDSATGKAGRGWAVWPVRGRCAHWERGLKCQLTSDLDCQNQHDLKFTYPTFFSPPIHFCLEITLNKPLFSVFFILSSVLGSPLLGHLGRIPGVKFLFCNPPASQSYHISLKWGRFRVLSTVLIIYSEFSSENVNLRPCVIYVWIFNFLLWLLVPLW